MIPMQLPLQRPISNAQYFVNGDVVIDECAAIAPGAILQADANSRLVIGPGVCVGMGAILHAHQGNLEIEAGAIIGAGVLVIGAVTIKVNACVGACSTIINTNLEPEQIVPAGSVIGDNSRLVSLTINKTEVSEIAEENISNATSDAEENISNATIANVREEEAVSDSPPETPVSEEPKEEESPPPENMEETQHTLYSQRHLNRLMGTLFPQGNYFSRTSQNGSSPKT